jgi:hypothetical protein
MAKTRPFTVLVSLDGGQNWERVVRRIPEADADAKAELTTWPAATGDRAIELVRDSIPELKANTKALFYAVGKFRPKKMRRQIFTKYELDYADKPDDEPTGEDGTRELPIG